MKKTLLLLFTIFISSVTTAQQNIEWQKTYGGNFDDECYSINNTTGNGYILGGVTNSNNGDVTESFGDYDIWVTKISSTNSLEWQKSLGGSGYEEAHSVFQTQDGNYVMFGFTNSSNNHVSNNKGGYDCWLVKLNNAGNTILFEKTYGGSGNDCYSDWSLDPEGFYKFSAKETSDNGFILAGYTSSNDGDVVGSGYHAMKDFWVVKTDPSGTITWKKSLGGSKNDEALDVIQTSDGGYLVTGYVESNDGDVSGNHSSYYDGWSVKLNSDGTISWKKCFGGANNDAFRSVVEANDGGFVYAGFSRSSDGDLASTGNSGQDDLWVFKSDNSGNKVWSVQLGGADFERAMSVDKTTDGGYIVSGYTNSTGGDVSGNHGGFDYWVVKLDKDGVVKWSKAMGGSNDDIAFSGKSANDGSILVGGRVRSDDGDITAHHSAPVYYDFWTAKLQAPPITCNLSISPTLINLTSDAGNTTINITAGSSWTATPGAGCSWLSLNPTSGTGNGSITATYSANTGAERTCGITIQCDSETKSDTIIQAGFVGIHELNTNSFTTFVSPNPVKDVVTLSFEKADNYQIYIHDVLGREIRTVYSGHAAAAFISCREFKSGIYFFTVSDKSGKKSKGKFAVLN